MMEDSKFIDCYEILEVSPNANSGTIDRTFRYLAQRYHPDNRDTGDRLRFEAVLNAYDSLRDLVKRAQYDIQHRNHAAFCSSLAEEVGDNKSNECEDDIQNRLLSVLYVKRRQSISDPGIGNLPLERLLGCPAERLEFHLWYMKEKGWIVKTEDGLLAITAEGVDRANSDRRSKAEKKLLTDRHATATPRSA
jgi:curved DNA-binding protein CbpA